MVNPGKRMRKLHPKLFRIRSGPGAALLPPPPAPQLTKISLQYKHDKRDSQGKQDPVGAVCHRFWRTHLQRLKYYNPALPVQVEQNNASDRLTLLFEGEDVRVLEAIRESERHGQSVLVKQPRPDMFEQLSKEDRMEQARREEERIRQQSPNWRDAPGKNLAPGAEREATDQKHDHTANVGKAEQQIDTDTDGKLQPKAQSVVARKAPRDEDDIWIEHDEVHPRPQPAADASAPSTVQAPRPIYETTRVLGLRNRDVDAIWEWFQERTRCVSLQESKEDQAQRTELERFFRRSKQDRRRVKEGVDAMKREAADLKRARGEAEKLQAEAV